MSMHDRIVARRLPRVAEQVDVLHVWPLAARRTLRRWPHDWRSRAVLERPNAHTRYAYTAVRDESQRLGVRLPPQDEHAFSDEILRREEEEYRLADFLLCPSDFVAKTFVEQGFPQEKLLRHSYGFDPAVYHPNGERRHGTGLTALFVGVAAVRKGLHFALDAWLRSPVSEDGTFLIAGEFLHEYYELLAPKLAHPSVKVLGHRRDVPALMRSSDILVLPSIEEGSALVCAEAMASGCVPVVSDASSGLVRHAANALVHEVGDVETLADHLTVLHEDGAGARASSGREPSKPLRARPGKPPARSLFDAYRQAVSPRPPDCGHAGDDTTRGASKL